MIIDRRMAIAGGAVIASTTIAQALRTIGMPVPPPAAPGANAASVRDFGAVGDGRADDRAAVQRAYDTLAQSGGGRLHFPPGRYRIALTLTSRAVHLCGSGASSSILAPATSDAPAVTALYRNGDIAPVSITDLGFRGSGQAGVLFSAGGSRYVADAEYSGGTHFARCAFVGAERCIERRFGAIDLQIDQCQFKQADYHIHVTTAAPDTGADQMHGGCIVMRRSWLTTFSKAMLFVDSPIEGSGQIVLEQNIVENGSGFVHYFRRFQGSRSPGIVIRDQWNEVTATGKDLVIGDRRHPSAQFLHAEQVTPTILVENTPVGAVELRAASLATRACDLSDLSVEADRNSSVTHELATALLGTVAGRTRSVAAPIQADPLQMPWFRIALPRARSIVPAAQLLLANDCTGSLVLTGSRTEGGRVIAGDAALPDADTSTEVTLRRGDRLFPQISNVIPADHWLVALLVYRTMAGEAMAQVTGSRGMSGGARLIAPGWEAIVSLCRPVDTAVPGNSLHLTSDSGAIVRLGGMALVALPTLAQGLDFANALSFPALAR